MSARPLRPGTAILLGGLAAATIDIVYAFLFFGLRSGIPPLNILQSIASGLLGREAREGGWETGALGLALHLFNGIAMAAIFYAASRYLPALKRRAVAAGLAYGVVVYLVMNFVVLPLSRYPYGRSDQPVVWISGLLVHMLGVGLPIALAIRRTPE